MIDVRPESALRLYVGVTSPTVSLISTRARWGRTSCNRQGRTGMTNAD